VPQTANDGKYQVEDKLEDCPKGCKDCHYNGATPDASKVCTECYDFYKPVASNALCASCVEGAWEPDAGTKCLCKAPKW